MQEDLLKVKNDALSLILHAQSMEELDALKLQFLGKNGVLTLLMKEVPNLPKDEVPQIGMLANDVKRVVEESIENAAKSLKIIHAEKTVQAIKKTLDVTAPGKLPPLGHLHLVTQTIDEITEIFKTIGFKRVRYPEVEWDHFAFEALNFPENHPARDDWETFFIDTPSDKKFGPMVLTPHTSSGQIRQMKKHKPPIKMLNIAKCYRRQSDVSHTEMFHQFETLLVGENISITHLKGMLDYFVKSYFGEKRRSRIRPYHFQFTEPSFETDVSCGVCDGTGKVESEKCRLCKEGWLEMGGAGMVHPNVIENCGLDPKKYTGFASGWGVERVLMMKEGISLDDLRVLYSNNLDFLEQF